MHENLHRLIELLNLQWLLQNRDRTDLKNPIEDLAIWVACDHDNVEVRINLLGCFKNLITGGSGNFKSKNMRSNLCFPRHLIASFAVPTTTRLKPIFPTRTRCRLSALDL